MTAAVVAKSSHLVDLALGWTVVVAPVLVLPGLLPESLHWVVAPLALATLVWAAWLVRGVASPSVAAATMLFLVCALLGWRRGMQLGSNGEHFYGISLGVLLMFLTAQWCRSRERLLAWAVAVCVLGVAVLGLGLRSATPPPAEKLLPSVPLTPAWPQPRLGMEGYLDRPPAELERGLYVNPNALAAAALMIIPVGTALGVAARAVAPGIGAAVAMGVGWSTALWALATIASTQSRAAWLIFAAIAALTGWRFFLARTSGGRSWTRPLRLWSSIVLLVLLVAAGTLMSDSEIWRRTMETLGKRGQLWPVAVDLLLAAPWSGIGLDAFRYLVPGVPHAHNILIQTALDLGVLGLGAYLVVVIWIARLAVRLARQGREVVVRAVAAGGGVALLSVHLFGVVDAIALGTKIGILQWLACGLVLAAGTVDRIGSHEDEPFIHTRPSRVA